MHPPVTSILSENRDSVAIFKKFYADNKAEILKLTASICIDLNYKGSIEDIIQDLYFLILTKNILLRYNPKKAKISTWLFSIIRNIVLSHINSDILTRKHIPFEYAPTYGDDYDLFFQSEIDSTYQSMIEANQENLAEEFKNFIRYLRKSSTGSRSTIKNRLAEIFEYMYKGYSGSEISKIYGVSDMAISHAKNLLTKALIKYGFLGR